MYLRAVTTEEPQPVLSDRFVGPRFVSDDGRLAIEIRRANDWSFPLRLVVTNAVSGALLIEAQARFKRREDEDAKAARVRLDTIEAELEIASIGPTYTLYMARPTDDRRRWNGYDNVALRDDTPLEEVLLMPEYGGTPFGPAEDEWDWQSGWWYPYSPFRLAR